ncbi:MAG: carbohydrate ABC transporter permease [Lachnospiraceae bacterium]
MKSTKSDNLEVKKETKASEVEEKAVHMAADSSPEGENNTDGKEHKKEKKKKYTVEELLNQEGRMELYDEYGRKKKIKVKVKTGKLKKREARIGYIFTAPYMIGVLVFLLYSVIMSVVYTFYNVYYHASGDKIMDFRGFYYYQRVFEKETDLLINLGSLSIKLLMAVPLIVVFSLLMAMLLNMKIRGKGIFRTIYFLPVIIVSGPVMTQITSETSSIQAVDLTTIQNVLLSVLPTWLAEGVTFIFSNILLLLWYSGVQILIFLAALQKIDTSLYEAAKIDGGSGWECFWKITLPTIKPMLLLNALYTVVFLSQDTLISPIISRISEVMQNNNEGYGYTSTFALLYSAIILVFVGVVALAFKPRKDLYEKQIRRTKKLEKKTRKNLAKHQKQLIKNEIKLQKAVEKEKKMIAAGKDLKGGNFDE